MFAMKQEDLAEQQRLAEARQTLWRRLGAFVAMFIVGMGFQSQVPTDWDAWDYAAQAIQGHSSDLLLGRWFHVATMRAAYLIASIPGQLSLPDAWAVMQATNLAIMSAAVAVGMAWTGRLTGSSAAEVVFALLFITGPMFGIYAGSIMTEPLTLLALSTGFWAWQRGIQADSRRVLWALAAGACLGVAVNVREPALLLCAWPVVSALAGKVRRRWAMLSATAGGAILVLGIGVLMAWSWYPVEYTGRTYWQNLAHWTADMAVEREQFAIQPLRQVWLQVQYSLAASPVATVLILPAVVWAVRRRQPIGWLALAATAYLLIVLVNHDLAVNPRFVMPWLWVMGPVVGLAVARACTKRGSEAGRRLLVAMALILAGGLVALTVGFSHLQRYYFGYNDKMARVYEALYNIRGDALIIAGPGTPVAYHLNRLELKDFQVIGSGWGWPKDDVSDGRAARTGQQVLADRLRAAAVAGRPIWVNMDRDMWDLVNRDSGEFEMLEAAGDQYQQIHGPARRAYLPMVQWRPLHLPMNRRESDNSGRADRPPPEVVPLPD